MAQPIISPQERQTRALVPSEMDPLLNRVALLHFGHTNMTLPRCKYASLS